MACDAPGWLGEELGPPLPYSVSPKQGLAISQWMEFPKLAASTAQCLVRGVGVLFLVGLLPFPGLWRLTSGPS